MLILFMVFTIAFAILKVENGIFFLASANIVRKKTNFKLSPSPKKHGRKPLTFSATSKPMKKYSVYMRNLSERYECVKQTDNLQIAEKYFWNILGDSFNACPYVYDNEENKIILD